MMAQKEALQQAGVTEMFSGRWLLVRSFKQKVIITH